MSNEQYNQWFKANKQFSVPFVEWNRLSSEWLQRVTQQQLDLVGDQFTRVSDQMKRFATVKKPEDFFSLQKDCMQENISASVDYVQTFLKQSMDHLDSFTKMCSSQASEVHSNSNKATERNK